ncbi:MAG: trypsin-like serine protease [Planctomycetales bacterium]|nr:trypsin-like serine protease [Planctomycetales bacterium]
MRIHQFPSVLGLLVFAATGCGAAPTDTRTEVAAAISAGHADDSDEAAVWIIAKVGAVTGYCSGVVVAPHVVLTAAHCSKPDATYSVFLGADYMDAEAKALQTNYVAVTEHHPHPSRDPALNVNDIGVLITGEPIPRAAATISREPLTDADLGAPVRIVGYGQTEGGVNDSYGRRNEGQTLLAAFDATSLTLAGLPNICLFDSGGPTFMQRAGGDVVIGIHYLIQSETCAAQGWDVRVDAYSDFVDAYIDTFDPTPDAGPWQGDDAGDAASSEGDEAGDASHRTPRAKATGCAIGFEAPTCSYPMLVGLAIALASLRRIRRARARVASRRA